MTEREMSGERKMLAHGNPDGDDELTSRLSLTGVLRKCGHKVMSTNAGKEDVADGWRAKVFSRFCGPRPGISLRRALRQASLSSA